MIPKRIVVLAVAATLLFGGMVAVGAASPAEQTENSTAAAEISGQDEIDDDEPERAGDRVTGTAGPAETAGLGPTDGLPAQVPDHVSDILDTVGAFLDGSIDSLGETVSELLGSETATALIESGVDK